MSARLQPPLVLRVLLAACLATLPACAASDSLFPITHQSDPLPGQVSISASASGITLVNRSAREICFKAIEEGMLALVNSAPPEQWRCGIPLKQLDTATIAWENVFGAAPQKSRYLVSVWQVETARDGSFLRALNHQGVVVVR